MEGVPQQDVKELDTLKEQDILAIIGTCNETNFILSIGDVCTWGFFNCRSQENRSKLQKNMKSCMPRYARMSVAMVSMLK